MSRAFALWLPAMLLYRPISSFPSSFLCRLPHRVQKIPLSSRHASLTKQPLLLFKYHKPRGVLSTTLPTTDGVNILQRSPHLASFISNETNRRFVVPIGRLDKDSHGLLLLTTEESITGKLLRPSSTPEGSLLEKEYHVVTNRKVKEADLIKLRSGMAISVPNFNRPRKQVVTRPCVVENLIPWDAKDRSLRFVLREGKNRQIRKMLGALGYSVVDLKRVRFGPVQLGDLAEGHAELMTDRDAQRLLNISALDSREMPPPPQADVRDVR